MRKLTLLILAAGKGTRLKSTLPKVLHQLAGKSLIEHVVEAARPLNPSATCVVVGYEAGRVQNALSHLPLQFAIQEPQLGTGHAVQVAGSFWKPNEGDLLVLSGDVPLISTKTLQGLLNQHTQSDASATLLSTKLEDPAGYGRVARSADGDVQRIVEHKDANHEERLISEINTGIYCFVIADLAQVIDQLSAENSQGEYYFTDCVGLLRKQNKRVSAVVCEDPSEVSGINSRAELAELERIVRNRKLKQLMQDGVTIIDPASTYVEPSVQIGADSVLYPNVFLEKGTVIGASCQIYPNVRISASTIEDERRRAGLVPDFGKPCWNEKPGRPFCPPKKSRRYWKPGPHREFCRNQELAARRQNKGGASELSGRCRDRPGCERRSRNDHLQL